MKYGTVPTAEYNAWIDAKFSSGEFDALNYCYSCIYALMDPRDDEVKYVGQTKCPYRRWAGHINESARRIVNNAIKEQDVWIDGLRKETGKPPTLLILEKCDRDDLDEREGWWHRKLWMEGHKLFSKVRKYQNVERNLSYNELYERYAALDPGDDRTRKKYCGWMVRMQDLMEVV